MDALVEALVRWQESKRGLVTATESEPMRRLQQRFRAIEAAQAQVSAQKPLPELQRELALQGDAGSVARGRFILRNRSARAVTLSAEQVAGEVLARIELPESLVANGSAACALSVDLTSVPPGLYQLAFDLLAEGAFRVRVWVTVEVT